MEFNAKNLPWTAILLVLLSGVGGYNVGQYVESQSALGAVQSAVRVPVDTELLDRADAAAAMCNDLQTKVVSTPQDTVSEVQWCVRFLFATAMIDAKEDKGRDYGAEAEK